MKYLPSRQHNDDVPGIISVDPEGWEFLQVSQDAGWNAALYVYGLRDCTIRNNGIELQSFPIGRREAYLELSSGEEATISTVEPEWGR